MSLLSDLVKKTGRLPQVSLQISPLETSRPRLFLKNFLSYSFQSSILIPVDSFQFSFASPTDTGSLYDLVREGDIVELFGHETKLSTGIVDVVEISVTPDGGVVGTVHGRDLASQLEDQNSVSIDSNPIWGNAMTVLQASQALIRDTRIRGVKLQDAPTNKYLLASDPGESKIATLQRFLEPLNCLFWMDADGFLVVGRPNMAQGSPTSGELFLEKDLKQGNVLSMISIRASTQIANIIVPIWSGQESVQTRISKEQAVYNNAEGPARLRRLNHRTPKSVVVGTPRGADAQSLSEVNRYRVSSSGGSNLLQAMAKRELARQNLKEHTVQCQVAGHTNDALVPFVPDQLFNIRLPQASVDEKMYLYEVNYAMDARSGQRTALSFTRLGTIVSDIRAR